MTWNACPRAGVLLAAKDAALHGIRRMKGSTAMSPTEHMLIVIAERLKKPFSTSEDWSRLAEIGRRASIRSLMRRNLKNFRITLVSEGSEEDLSDAFHLALYISPRLGVAEQIRQMGERELKQLIDDLESMEDYIDGLDDALPGETD
jgi:hypothetical protein